MNTATNNDDNGGNPAAENFAAPPRTLGESIDGWSRKHWSFSGRASRSEFWWTCAFIGLLQTAFTLTIPGLFDSPNAMWIARVVINLWFLMPVLAVLTRRLHDIGRSGWWFWAVLLPWLPDTFALEEWQLFADYMADANLPGLVWLLHSAIAVGLLLWWGCKPGQCGKNRFDDAA